MGSRSTALSLSAKLPSRRREEAEVVARAAPFSPFWATKIRFNSCSGIFILPLTIHFKCTLTTDHSFNATWPENSITSKARPSSGGMGGRGRGSHFFKEECASVALGFSYDTLPTAVQLSLTSRSDSFGPLFTSTLDSFYCQ